MSEAKPLFPKQFVILIVLFATVFIISRVAIDWGDEEVEVTAYLAIAKNLPEIPELNSWPEAYYESLKTAYSGLGDFDGEFLRSYQEIGCLYLQNGFLAEARSVFETLLTLDEKNQLWLYCYAKSWGELLDGNGIEALETLVSNSGEYLKAHSLLIETLCANGRRIEALAIARDSVERWPSRTVAKYDLVNVLLSIQRDEEAFELLSELESSGMSMPGFREELFDAFGSVETVSEGEEGSQDYNSVARLSQLNLSDPFEDYLESFQYAYSDLAKNVENKIRLGQAEGAENALTRLRELYPDDALNREDSF